MSGRDGWLGRFDQRDQSVIGPQINVAGNAIISPPPPSFVPHLPSAPKDFTGRNEELHELLTNFDHGAAITGLCGMGGIGKTALAYVLADKLASGYPDGQILVELKGTSTEPMTPANAMIRVVRAYNPEAKLPENEADLASIYHSVLHDKHALLLLDNAADRKQVEPLLPPKGCAVIVTSRKKFTLPGMSEPFLLATMKPSEARDLLIKICPRVGDNADELAELCGYLPLALRASASLLAVKRDQNIESYLEELRQERTRLKRIGNEGVDLDVEASFNLSYSRLSEEMASVFCKLSIFPSDFDAAAEEAICQDQDNMQLSSLVIWSLVEFEEETGRYHLHDLMRLFAAKRLEAAGAEVSRSTALQHAEYYKKVLSSATVLYKHGGKDQTAGLRKFDLERINIDAGWAWIKDNFKDDNAVASLCSAYPDSPFLFELRLHPKEQISWLETALVAARQLKDKNMEGTHLGSLGNAYAYLGNAKKAIEYYEKCLTIHQEIGDRRGEGNDLGNMGVSYKNLGETHKAIEYYERALVIYRENGDRRNEGNVLGNLANAYDLGDAKKAIEYYTQCLIIHREIGDRRGEGNNLGNMGSSYAALGDARKAIDYYEMALAIDREIGNRLGEGNALGNLANAYAAQGDARKAFEYDEKHLVIAREIGDRRGEGNALWNMSLSLDKLRQRTEAIDCARSALKIYEQIESPYAEMVRQALAKWQK